MTLTTLAVSMAGISAGATYCYAQTRRPIWAGAAVAFGLYVIIAMLS